MIDIFFIFFAFFFRKNRDKCARIKILVSAFFFFRGDHIVPNFEEIWPSKTGKKAVPKRGLEYYYDAMQNGPQLSGDCRNSTNFSLKFQYISKISIKFLMDQIRFEASVNLFQRFLSQNESFKARPKILLGCHAKWTTIVR